MKTLRVLVLISIMNLFGGCSQPPLLERPIPAETTNAFAKWQVAVRPEFGTEGWAEFEAVLQDIKLKLMADEVARGTDAVNDALRKVVHNTTVREVLLQGMEARLWRQNVERTELEKMIAANATLTTRAGDAESARYLERKRADQVAKLEQVKRAIQATEKRIAELKIIAAK